MFLTVDLAFRRESKWHIISLLPIPVTNPIPPRRVWPAAEGGPGSGYPLRATMNAISRFAPTSGASMSTNPARPISSASVRFGKIHTSGA